MVPPHGRVAISVVFKPQEGIFYLSKKLIFIHGNMMYSIYYLYVEITYNFNLHCEIKRKPTRLSLNIKGEGYAVHSLIQLEQQQEEVNASTLLLTLKPSPSVSTLDFGTVQVRESTSKKFIVTNTGKYNFDYIWETDFVGTMINVSGGKLGGTLKKGEEISYEITFAPLEEKSVPNMTLNFVVAGKYIYRILPRGVGVAPALKFSFLSFDFGNCFITSPGGDLVMEETTLVLSNHDKHSSISVESLYQKTGSLWADCPPTIIEAGKVINVCIKFAPREIKDYTFILPFLINGSSRVSITITGRGIPARVELVNGSQRRINLGTVSVNGEVVKTVPLINRASKAIVVQLIEEGSSLGALALKYVSFAPMQEILLPPRSSTNIILNFAPHKRVPLFNEELSLRCAGVTRKFLTISGRAQGLEVCLETDSLPFGSVVEGSLKVKRLRLENQGDVPVNFQWNEATFGTNFSISPVAGKLPSGSDIMLEVTFKPQSVNADIRQDDMILEVLGLANPLLLSCSGSCIPQPVESKQILSFSTQVRATETKATKIINSTDKDWYISPSVEGIHWSVPFELRIPAKGSADLAVSYKPLFMAIKPTGKEGDDSKDEPHFGQIFIPLPDGSALLYQLKGYASAPASSGHISIETVCKRPKQFSASLVNWLGDFQKFEVLVKLTEKPSPAVFVISAKSVEIQPHGMKDFPMRYFILGSQSCCY